MTTPSWILTDNTHREPHLFRRLRRPFYGKGARVVPAVIDHGFRITKEGLGGVLLERSGVDGNPFKALQLYCGGGRTRLLYRTVGWQAPTVVYDTSNR